MEQKKQTVMTDQLAAHILALKSKMMVMGYSKNTQRNFNKIWNTLLEYTNSRKTQVFSAEYSQTFIEETYGAYYENKYSQYRVIKPMVMLLDFIRLGVVIRQKNHGNKEFSEKYKMLFEGFLTTQMERGLSMSSIISIRSRLHRLENFLLDSGIGQFSDVTRTTVSLYIESFISRSTSTSSSSLREFGRLCDYAATNGFHAESFSNMIPHVRNIRRQRLPHTFTSDEIQKIIGAVDRSNARL